MSEAWSSGNLWKRLKVTFCHFFVIFNYNDKGQYERKRRNNENCYDGGFPS